MGEGKERPQKEWQIEIQDEIYIHVYIENLIGWNTYKELETSF